MKSQCVEVPGQKVIYQDKIDRNQYELVTCTELIIVLGVCGSSRIVNLKYCKSGNFFAELLFSSLLICI